MFLDGRELKLTNLDKVLYPEAGFTKGEMVDYYARAAPAIIPHLAGRAMTLRRFPKTSGSKGLQVYVPLNRKASYEQTKPFAKELNVSQSSGWRTTGLRVALTSSRRRTGVV